MLFVTATDTGVGKTTFAAALARTLRAKGRAVGVLKPFESGCEPRPDGSLWPRDAATLKAAAGAPEPLEALCPHRYALPLAPGIAASRLGEDPGLGTAVAAFERLRTRYEHVVVEGAGGLLVPLTPRHSVADLAAELALPLVVVARVGLGTLNHSLLTVEAARRRGLEVRALVLNDSPDHPPGPDPSREDNAAALGRLTGLPVLGPLPRVDRPDAIDPWVARWHGVLGLA